MVDPSAGADVTNKQVCTTVKSAKSNSEMDEDVKEILSEKKDLPRFIGLELDLTFVFK